jgi:hypothetical protein
MVNLVDECLRGPLFERATGFATADVVVADPGVGTGTFLLGVLRRIAKTVEDDQGAGAVRGAIEAAAKRIIGFEMQFGPLGVAQLRLLAELQALMGKPPLPTCACSLPIRSAIRSLRRSGLGRPTSRSQSHAAPPTR